MKTTDFPVAPFNMRMKIKLSVQGTQSGPASPNESVVFGTAGGTIGRRQGNDLVLPDSKKYVSGNHARIIFQEGSFYIQDTSTNGVCVNEPSKPIGKGTLARLKDGDELYIGDYILKVCVEESPIDIPPHRQGMTHDIDGGFEQKPFPAGDPFAFEDTGTTEKPVIIPDDISEYDLFGNKPRIFESQANHSPAVDDYFDPPLAVEPIPQDWDQPTTNSNEPPFLPDQETMTLAPDYANGKRELKVTEKCNDKTPVQNRGARSRDREHDSSLVLAFLNGAGIDDIAGRHQSDSEFMELAGALFRALVHGLMQILVARASLKNELRIPGTLLKPRENNPLKFSISAEETMSNLLLQPSPGRMAPLEAVNEAYQDMTNHQIAVIAAMQEAYDGLLKQFDPATLEKTFVQEPSFPAIRLFKKRFKYWEQYSAFYEQITKDAGEGFTKLFGEAFSRAYEVEVKRLAKERPVLNRGRVRDKP